MEKLWKILAMLGNDRPVVKTEAQAGGVVRVTFLGGDAIEVSLDSAGQPEAAGGKPAAGETPQEAQRETERGSRPKTRVKR